MVHASLDKDPPIPPHHLYAQMRSMFRARCPWPLFCRLRGKAYRTERKIRHLETGRGNITEVASGRTSPHGVTRRSNVSATEQERDLILMRWGEVGSLNFRFHLATQLGGPLLFHLFKLVARAISVSTQYANAGPTEPRAKNVAIF